MPLTLPPRFQGLHLYVTPQGISKDHPVQLDFRENENNDLVTLMGNPHHNFLTRSPKAKQLVEGVRDFFQGKSAVIPDNLRQGILEILNDVQPTPTNQQPFEKAPSGALGLLKQSREQLDKTIQNPDYVFAKVTDGIIRLLPKSQEIQ